MPASPSPQSLGLPLAPLPGRPRVGTRTLALFLALIIALASAGPAQAASGEGADPTAPTLAVSILKRLPHDPSAFTQGLIFHQGQLIESTGLYGQSSLRRVDPETGRVLALARLAPRLFGEGLALVPARPGAAPRLVQLTWREGLVLTYDPGSLRHLTSLRLRGELWGLTWDGKRLILSDGSDTLRLLEPLALAKTGRLAVREGQTPLGELNELEWVEGWLLANVLGQDRIAVIRPPGSKDAGQVAAWLDLSPLRRELAPSSEVANGIAYDPHARALYVTGKRWDRVFVLALPELLQHPPGKSPR